MKSKTLFGILLVAFALAGFGVWAHKTFGKGEAATPPPGVLAPASKLVVYYFHTTYRCATCNKLEAYAKEAIEKGFPGELKRGEVAFASVNVEHKGNEHYIEDYQLKTKSLVLVATGKTDRWKNLELIWDKVAVKDGYVHYVQDETKTFLLGLN